MTTAAPTTGAATSEAGKATETATGTTAAATQTATPTPEIKPGEAAAAAGAAGTGGAATETKKTEDGKQTETPAAKGEKTPSVTPPAKYALTLPDSPHVDETELKQVESLAKANGWSNADAQAALDEHAAAIKAQATTFLETTKADSELGGDHYVETERLVRLAMDRLHPEGTKHGDEFRKLLTKSGYGNHPTIVRHLRRLGALMAEDSGAGVARVAVASKRSPEEVLYGKPATQ